MTRAFVDFRPEFYHDWYQDEPHADARYYEGRAVNDRLPTNVRIIAGNDRQTKPDLGADAEDRAVQEHR